MIDHAKIARKLLWKIKSYKVDKLLNPTARFLTYLSS